MNWNQLLSDKRFRGPYHTSESNGRSTYASTDNRSEFQKDYHRIIGSASFRRLQDKAQVFPLERSDFVRTRLTHSLEVASYAKSLGQTCFQYIIDHELDPQVTQSVREQCCQILECAGLLHDIGNPPFGHFGEDAIRSWFEANFHRLTDIDGTPASELLTDQMREDLLHFEGNAQALRLVSKLHYLVDENGMNLTYALLNTLIKYPVPSVKIDKHSGNIKDKKMGYYYAEEELFSDIVRSTGAIDCRYPLTFLLEAADDIAYKTADIEDAVKKGFVTYNDLVEELQKRLNAGDLDEGNAEVIKTSLDKLRSNYDRACSKGISSPEVNAVQNWVIYLQGRLLACASYAFTSNYRAIMAGTFPTELLKVSFGAAIADLLSDIAVSYVFRSQPIYKLEIGADVMLRFLMDHLVPAAIQSEDPKHMGLMERKWFSLISDNYRQAYETHARGRSQGERLYLRLLLVTDYVCGMTDSFAKQLYQELTGIV